MSTRLVSATVIAIGLSLSGVNDSTAYEFEVSARTIGQSRSLDTLRLIGPRVRLSRRRITQNLQLNMWDLAGKKQGLSLFDPTPVKGPNLYFSSYMRLDQDFGSFTTGQLQLGGQTQDALDVVPELQRYALQFDVLYAYAGAEGLLDGRVDMFLGRLLEVQTLDWFSMDGLKVRGHFPSSIAIDAFGGLRVRENSPAGTDAQAPDGTPGSLCEEYVEGALPGSGSWRPIDGLPIRDRDPFTSDDEFCPQRHAIMPTFGAAIEIEDVDWLRARLSYRRSQSKTVGLIGESDRLNFEDLGLYPNEQGQAPKWGVNEERVALSIRTPWEISKKTQLVPYVAARYSILHGLVDEAHAGARWSRSNHSVESELFYSVPTFDGDSIFNVFSTEPYTDARSTWEYDSKEARLGGYVRGWGRRYHSEDAEQADTSDANDDAFAGGVQVGTRYQVTRKRVIRVDGFHEDGYGGLRTGGYISSWWQWTPKLASSLRLSGIYFDEDLRQDLFGFNYGAQLGITYLVNEGVSTRLSLEENSNRIHSFEMAAFVIIDLAFQPET